jgi:hypothetical protein
MDHHAFTPSRFGGAVCVAERTPAGDGWPMEPCGYPAGHPIHESATVAPPLTADVITQLRAAIVEHGAACYRRGRADASGMQSAQMSEQRAVRAAMDVVDGLIKALRGAR